MLIETDLPLIHQEGEEVSWKSSGWEARILQHEVDHLHGKMFIDKVTPCENCILSNSTQLYHDAPM